MALSKLNSENDGLGRQVWVWLAGVAVLFVVGLILAFLVAGRDRDRQIQLLEQEMALAASGRAQAVSVWLNEQRGVVDRLAANPAVAIYAMGAQEPAAVRGAAVGAGQAEYLARLLETTVAQTGFAEATPPRRANVELPVAPGLAILGRDGREIASFGGPLPEAQAALPRAAEGVTVTDYGVRLGEQYALSFLAPVPEPQGGEPVAYVYGVRALTDVERVLTTASERFQSVRAGLYVRGGADGADGALVRGNPDRLPTPAQLAAMAAAPGRLHDYGNTLVMVQPVAGTPLFLVRAIDSGEALGPVNLQWRLRLLALLALVALVTALILLAWRHGASKRAAQSAAVARETAEREARLRAFLSTVADRQPTLIAVVDQDGLLRFSNARLRAWLNAGEDAHGVPLARLFGEAGPAIADLLAQARTAEAAEALVDLKDADGAVRRHQVEAVAMPEGETLLVAHDITELLAERARREANMAALVLALTGLIDARDPGSRHHSEKVSAVAAAVAAELGLDAQAVETVRLAGQLMNLGKIMVPRRILTKEGPLTEEERAIVRASLAQSAGILANVPFDGPVAETVAGVDSPSPSPLSRVLRLANALVGMVSPRAFRNALPLDEALALLRRDAQPEDAQILSAMAHVIDNRGGREILEV